jgi:uncharacterized membrane protein
MNKFANIAILVLLGIFISFRINVACNQLAQENEVITDADTELPALFTGVLPCASCPGIQYLLILKKDSFEEVSLYIDRNPGEFTETGTWNINRDTLRISDDSGRLLKSFLYRENELLLLDREENQAGSEHRDSYRLTRSPEFRSIYEQHQRLKEEDGIRLIASGNEPFWGIRIDNENELLFQAPDSSFTITVNKPAEDGGLLIYQSEHDFGEFHLHIEKGVCLDSMSGYPFTHTVSLTLAGQSLNGCALFPD